MAGGLLGNGGDQMKCPFCETHVDKHKTGVCMNAWLLVVSGKCKKEDLRVYKHGNTTHAYLYSGGSNRGEMLPIEGYSTDINLFYRHLAPEIWPKRNVDTSGEPSSISIDNPMMISFMSCPEPKEFLLYACRAYIKMKTRERDAEVTK